MALATRFDFISFLLFSLSYPPRACVQPCIAPKAFTISNNQKKKCFPSSFHYNLGLFIGPRADTEEGSTANCVVEIGGERREVQQYTAYGATILG